MPLHSAPPARRLAACLLFAVAALLASPAARAQPVLLDLYPGSPGSSPSYLAVYKGDLYFSAFTGERDASGTVVGTELYRLDGGAAALAADVQVGSFSEPRDLTAAGGLLFFSAEHTGRELFAYDPADGARLVEDVEPGVFGLRPGGFGVFSGSLPCGNGPAEVFFYATTSSHGTELWGSDGTPEGTCLVDDLNLGTASSFPSGLTPSSGRLYFSARDGRSADDTGWALWSTDGSSIDLAADVAPTSPHGSVIPIGRDGSVLYLAAEANDGRGRELRRYTVGNNGIALVKDINPNGHGAAADIAHRPDGLAPMLDGEVYFMGNDGTTGWELWASDGSASGTRRVADINPNGNSLPQHVTVFDGKVYFRADDGVHGTELWESDGTAAGTQMVADLNPGAASSTPNFLTVYADDLYFQADDGQNGTELWRLGGGNTPLPPPPIELSVTETIGVQDEADALLALRIAIEEAITVEDEAKMLLALLVAIEETIGVQDDVALTPALPETPPCDPDLRITAFDADGAPSGEFVEITNVGADAAALGGCSVVVFDVFTERVTRSDPLAQPALAAGEALTHAFPPNSLPDNPGAFGVFDDPDVAVGTAVSDLIGTQVAAVVYLDEKRILGRFPAAGKSGGFAAALQAAADTPAAFVLEGNHPNPFRDGTTIRFALPAAQRVRLVVYDALGREVEVLVDGDLPAGRHTVRFDGSGRSSGLYVYRLSAGPYAAQGTMVRVR